MNDPRLCRYLAGIEPDGDWWEAFDDAYEYLLEWLSKNSEGCYVTTEDGEVFIEEVKKCKMCGGGLIECETDVWAHFEHTNCDDPVPTP